MGTYVIVAGELPDKDRILSLEIDESLPRPRVILESYAGALSTSTTLRVIFRCGNKFLVPYSPHPHLEIKPAVSVSELRVIVFTYNCRFWDTEEEASAALMKLLMEV